MLTNGAEKVFSKLLLLIIDSESSNDELSSANHHKRKESTSLLSISFYAFCFGCHSDANPKFWLKLIFDFWFEFAQNIILNFGS